jgi:hypothetical protein
LVFLFQDSLSPDELELFLNQFALIPARYSEAFASGETDLAAVDFVPFFTMIFLHGGCRPTKKRRCIRTALPG